MHRLIGILLLGLVSACSAESPSGGTPPAAEPPRFVAGTDYTVLQPPQSTRAPVDKIELVEVFGYSCIHCAHLQPLINEWKPTLADDVHFEYVPAVFGGVWEAYARVFYTAQTMGVLERSHDALFKAIHEESRFNSLEDVAGFYAQYDIDPQQFIATMSSFPVEAKVNEARERVPAWGVEGTPTMIVASKYRVTVPRVDNGMQRMLEVVDFLIATERAERAAAR